MVQRFDFLVIGSGIAGMSFALKVASKGKVALVCKTNLEEANTYFDQGGIASVVLHRKSQETAPGWSGLLVVMVGLG